MTQEEYYSKYGWWCKFIASTTDLKDAEQAYYEYMLKHGYKA